MRQQKLGQPLPLARATISEPSVTTPRTWPLGVAALVATLLIAVLSVGVGSVSIPPDTTIKIILAQIVPGTLIEWPAAYERILLDIRLPRVALIALSGAALACSGAAYQGLFRNALADPYLIGVASGAGLGAILALGLQAPLGALAVPLGAFAGALTTVAAVYTLGRSGRSTSTTALILAGVAIGSAASAVSTYVMLAGGHQVTRVLAFLLGGYGGAGWGAVAAVAPFTLVGTAALCVLARPLNLLLWDEDQARRLGVSVERVKLAVIVAATMTTAAAVAFSGLIGFVGLIVPHVVRMLAGGDHRRLIPLAAIGGAAFLMGADLVARTAAAPQELPLGVVTALAGAPFFLWLLRRSGR
jgi:iron complex transport system permease protein